MTQNKKKKASKKEYKDIGEEKPKEVQKSTTEPKEEIKEKSEDTEMVKEIKEELQVERKGEKARERDFYRNFVFRCKKCEEEFEHAASIPQEGKDMLEITVICPKCKEAHTLMLDLSNQELELSKMLKMMRG